MLVMQQPHQRHGHLPLVSSSPHSLQQTYQRATPPSVTCYSEQQSSSAGLFPYNQYSSNFGLYSTSSCPHIGGSAGSYYTNSTCSPTQMDSSPIGSPTSSIPSPQSPQLTISENAGASNMSYEPPSVSSTSTVLKYTTYPHHSNNYMLASTLQQTSDTSSTHYSTTVPEPPCYNSSLTSSNTPFSYMNYFTNGTNYSSSGASTLYPFQDYFQYQNSTVANSSQVTQAALWSYPALQVGQLSKVSYDSPRYKLTPERAIPLIKWFEEHKDHPYPSRQEKMMLCQTTQLTFTQVSTWFANARRRMKKAAQEDDEDDECDDSETTN